MLRLETFQSVTSLKIATMNYNSSVTIEFNVKKETLEKDSILDNNTGEIKFRIKKIRRILKLDESKGFST